MTARGAKYAARRAGRATYFTGVPCKRGHVADRFTHNGSCRECERAYLERRRRARGVKPRSPPWTPEQVRERRRARVRLWRKRHPERHAADVGVWKAKKRAEAQARREARVAPWLGI
jgi:hypothetical protein